MKTRTLVGLVLGWTLVTASVWATLVFWPRDKAESVRRCEKSTRSPPTAKRPDVEKEVFACQGCGEAGYASPGERPGPCKACGKTAWARGYCLMPGESLYVPTEALPSAPAEEPDPAEEPLVIELGPPGEEWVAHSTAPRAGVEKEQGQDDQPPEGLRLIGSPEELAIRHGISPLVLDSENKYRKDPNEHWLVATWAVTKDELVFCWNPRRVSIEWKGTRVYRVGIRQIDRLTCEWAEPDIFRPGPWMDKAAEVFGRAGKTRAERERADLEQRYGAID